MAHFERSAKMTTNRFDLHRALLADPEAKKEELKGGRRLGLFLGCLVVGQAVLAHSWVAGILIVPCAILAAANRATGKPHGPFLFLLSAVSAGVAEFVVLLSMFVESAPRFGTLLLGAIVVWTAIRSLRIFRELRRLEPNQSPQPTAPSDRGSS
jgi:hypothetical protein